MRKRRFSPACPAPVRSRTLLAAHALPTLAKVWRDSSARMRLPNPRNHATFTHIVWSRNQPAPVRLPPSRRPWSACQSTCGSPKNTSKPVSMRTPLPVAHLRTLIPRHGVTRLHRERDRQPSARTIAAMVDGPMRQHPPMTCAPASAHAVVSARSNSGSPIHRRAAPSHVSPELG